MDRIWRFLSYSLLLLIGLRVLSPLPIDHGWRSAATNAVLEEVSDWQNRVLEPIYPIVFLDTLRVKIRAP
ncbi:MAG: hypothetical protein ACJA0F_002407 [Dinoroseobacter sp.]